MVIAADSPAALDGFLRVLPHCSNANDLLDRLQELLVHGFVAASFRVFLLDEITGDLVPCRSFGARRLPPAQAIRNDGALAGCFQTGGCDALGLHPADTSERGGIPNQPAIDRLKALGAEWAFPLHARDKLAGLLLIGRRRDRGSYCAEDLQRLRLLARHVGAAVDRLLLADELELVGRISRGMAHDLQSLLMPISTFLQLTHTGEAPPESRTELLPVALKNLETISTYIKQALVFSRRHAPQFQRARLDLLLRRAVELAEAQWRQKRLSVRVRAPREVMVEMDEVLILRLIGNLLANAIHAAPPKSRITITLRRCPSSPANVEQVRVRITDEGKGIGAETLKRLLSPTFARKKEAEAAGSSGLGLDICRKITHLHHGALSLTRTAGKGTMAQVRLPVCQPDNELAQEPATAAAYRAENLSPK